MILTVDKNTWAALRLIQDSLTFMNRNRNKYSIALDKEHKLYKYMIKEIYDNCT